jgi:CHAD domain-containing protein
MAKTLSPRQALQDRLDAFTERLGRIHDRDAEARHQTRVASRRLRELLPLLSLKAETTRKLNRRLKRVTRELGTVRELDVLALLIRDFSREARYSPTALKSVATSISEERDTARKRLATKLPVTKLRRLADRINDAVKDHDAACRHDHARSAHRPKQGWVWAAEARIVRRAARLDAALDAAGALYNPPRLHDVRIALKKLRYAAELATETRERGENADTAALKGAQDLLGHLHDVEMLVSSTRDVQAAQSAPHSTSSRELDSLLRALETECRALHARFMHDRKRLVAIVNRLRQVKPQRAFLTRRAG